MSIDRTQEPQAGAIRAFHFPPTSRGRLPNELEWLVAHQPKLPLVTIRIVVDAGAATEQPGEEGLATLVANALEGGTERLSGEALAWEMERAGLQLETWATWDALHLSCTAVKEQLPAALALLREIARQPSFPPAEVERMRAEQEAELLQRQVEPRALADDMAAHFLFADGSVYGRPLLGRAQSVAGLTADDVRRFHDERFRANAISVILAGDIDDALARDLLQREFGDWQDGAGEAPTVTATPRHETLNLQLVDRPGAVQTELRLGHVGVARSHPDFFAILVMNAILGGAFTSRLNLSLREKHGFTYGVRSGFAFRRAPGPFIIQTAVATDVTVRAVQEALREVDLLLQQGPTEEEVVSARNYLAGVFPLELQTTEQLAAKLADVATYRLPTDYFDHYRDHITAITRADVVRAARTHIHLDHLTIVVVGDAQALAPALADAGIAPITRHAQSPLSAAQA